MEKKFDLEDRTLEFSKSVLHLLKKLPYNIENAELKKQLTRSSCSIGANYREGNDALGKKDFVFRVRVARKECKETIYWLRLILEINANLQNEILPLIDESIQLNKILSSIIEKSK